MKFEEALLAMRDGKKVRNCNSPFYVLYISEYFYKTDDGKDVFVTHNDEKVKTIFIKEHSLLHGDSVFEANLTMASIVMDDWEIVDEI